MSLMGLVDIAVLAFLGLEPVQRVRAYGDADVRGDNRGGAACLSGSLLYPAAGLGSLCGRHPVEKDAVGDCAAEMAHAGAHGCDDDARPFGKPVSQLGYSTSNVLHRRPELTGPHPDPKLRGVEPKTGDLCRDAGRLMPVDGKHSDTQLQLRGARSELCEHLQAGGGWLVVRPQRVVPQMLTADREVASNPWVEAG
jgi:hypothetical protein